MQEQRLAPHESLEIHEMLNFKTVCLAKTKLMQGIVFNNELKALMEKDIQQSLLDIRELQALYEHAPIH